MKVFKKFIQLSAPEKVLFFEAVFFLYCTKILLLLFPFKQIVKFFSRKKGKDITPEEQTLVSIKYAVARANRLAFWKNVCLVQSLTARWMLNRRSIPSVLSLGIKHNKNGRLMAHAWIKVSHFEIINEGIGYTELISIN